MEPALSHFTLFHFIRPWFLLAILPSLLVFILLWFKKPHYGSWHQIISPHLLPHLLQGTAKQQSKWSLVLILIGWILASIALAGPTWSKLPQTVQKKVNATVVILDLSLSMLAQDIKPSRLTRAQHKLSDILNQSKEGLTGLITYAGTSHVVSPLTDDTHTILSMVTSLSPEIMPIKGSSPALAVEKAVELLHQAGINKGQLLLITDDVPSDFVTKVKKFLNPSLTPVSIFAIGTNDGAPIPLSEGSFVRDANGGIVVPKLNPQRLKTAAKALNGRFSTLSSDDEDINYLMGNSSSLLNDDTTETDRDFDTWEESGLLFVLLLLPLAAMANRRGWLSMLLLPTLLTLSQPPSAEAAEWDDLWQTKDQQGQAAWRNNQIEQSAELFNDPEWKASAQYKSGNYQESADTLQQHITTNDGNTADNHYNLGNALAKQQNFDGAIDAYDQALSLDPDMQDAKNNKELVKKIQEQQQEQEGDGESKDDDKQKDDQDKKDQENKKSDDNKDSDDEKSEQQQNQEEQDQKNQDQQDQDQQDQDKQNKDDEEKDAKDKDQEKSEQEKNAEEESKKKPSPQEIEQSNLDKEDKQALEQWLRRIPDDPGGLLRRKFAQESKLRRNQPVEDKQW